MAQTHIAKSGARPALPRPVWLVSWTSFFTDTASEAIYPLLPLFLTRVVGGTALSIGVIEGAAEAVSSLVKIVSGRMSDRWRVRKPFVLAGYSLSCVVRPLVAFASSWPHVLLVRMADRVGKGIRGAPRDALIASWADPATRGYAFGLNRSMDHAGAVVGPLLASAFLWCHPGQYRTLFMLTVVPGLVGVLMLLPIPEAEAPRASSVRSGSGSERSHVWPPLGRMFYRYLAIVLLFSLGNSTDAFLLLQLSQSGVGDAWIPLVWAALHVVKSSSSPIGGRLSDRLNRRVMIIIGWVIYAGVYAAFATVSSLSALVAVFLVYGVYYGLTEGVEKAVVADLAPAEARGHAFGVYNATIGIGSLAASLVFGAIWKFAGAPAAFTTGAVLALLSAALLAITPLSRHRL